MDPLYDVVQWNKARKYPICYTCRMTPGFPSKFSVHHIMYETHMAVAIGWQSFVFESVALTVSVNVQNSRASANSEWGKMSGTTQEKSKWHCKWTFLSNQRCWCARTTRTKNFETNKRKTHNNVSFILNSNEYKYVCGVCIFRIKNERKRYTRVRKLHATKWNYFRHSVRRKC